LEFSIQGPLGFFKFKFSYQKFSHDKIMPFAIWGIGAIQSANLLNLQICVDAVENPCTFILPISGLVLSTWLKFSGSVLGSSCVPES
jgi:hypothetical protein